MALCSNHAWDDWNRVAGSSQSTNHTTHTHIIVQTYFCMHTNVCTHMHTDIQTYIYTCVDTYILTYIHSLTLIIYNSTMNMQHMQHMHVNIIRFVQSTQRTSPVGRFHGSRVRWQRCVPRLQGAHGLVEHVVVSAQGVACELTESVGASVSRWRIPNALFGSCLGSCAGKKLKHLRSLSSMT